VVAAAVEAVVTTQEHQLLQEMLEDKSPTLMLILLVDLVEVVQVKDHLLLVVLEKIVLDRILVVPVPLLVVPAVVVLEVLVLLPLVVRLRVLVVLVFKFLQHSKILPQHPDQLVVV
jgi:hypothetical protein